MNDDYKFKSDYFSIEIEVNSTNFRRAKENYSIVGEDGLLYINR